MPQTQYELIAQLRAGDALLNNVAASQNRAIRESKLRDCEYEGKMASMAESKRADGGGGHRRPRPDSARQRSRTPAPTPRSRKRRKMRPCTAQAPSRRVASISRRYKFKAQTPTACPSPHFPLPTALRAVLQHIGPRRARAEMPAGSGHPSRAFK